MTDQFEQMAAGARELRISLQRGDVQVRASEDSEWRLEYTSDSHEAPEIERNGDVVRIRQRTTHFLAQKLDLSVVIPPEVRVIEAKTGYGKIRVEEIDGRFDLSTGNGSLTVMGGGGEAEIASGNGEVLIQDFDGRLKASTGNGVTRVEDSNGDLRLNTGNGRVEISRADGRIRVATGNGDIKLEGVGGEVEANTGHGKVDVGDSESLALRANSAMGDIRVYDGSLRSARINSMVGEIRCEAQLEPGKYEMSTGMGALTIQLPPNVRARIDAQTGFGQVHSDFPLVRVGRSGPMGFGGVRMVGSITDDRPDIEIGLRTAKGQINIRRGQPYRAARATDSQRPATRDREWDLSRSSAPVQDQTGERRDSARDETLRVLEAVARGELSAEEADRLLKENR